MRDLLDYRSEFPILEHTTYLINHSLGAMPAKAEAGLAEYARTWRERGIRSWAEGWWTMPLTVGDQIGRIVGGKPGTTVMHQNVAVAEAVVLSSFFPVEPARNRIVYERENFPSVRYLYEAQPGLEVVVCEDDAAIADAIDERTLLVPISHVLFKTGEIQEIEPIIRRAHEAGAHVVLDCYQSAGIVPFDVTALNVDFAVGGSVKWLNGGPGNGWLYVRPDLAERLQPTFTGWQAHERPFAFEEEMDYAGGAARFLTGTPNVPALYAATAGYDLIEEIGVEPDPRGLAAPDPAADRSRRQGRLRGAKPAEPGAPRWHGDRARAGVRGGAPGAGRATDPLRLPPRRGHPPRPSLLQLRRRASIHDRADRGHPRDRRLRAARRSRCAALGRRLLCLCLLASDRSTSRDLQKVGDHHVVAADGEVVGIGELLDARDLRSMSPEHLAEGEEAVVDDAGFQPV